MGDTILPGDLGPGDVIMLPGADHEQVVVSVRLGRGGFLIAVAETSAPWREQVVVLTTWTPVLRRSTPEIQAWPHLLPARHSDLQA